MSGNGVVMMKKFIEANGLLNSESPAIFEEVYKALGVKLTRIQKIKAMYAETDEQAPLVMCPECGSHVLLSRNCEFCSYDMVTGDATEIVENKPEPINEEKKETRTVRNNKPEPVTDTKPEVKAEPLPVEASATEDKPAKTTRAKKELVVPTKEEILKARRPGLKKIVDAHKIAMTVDLDKAELKDIRNEMLSVLLGEEVSEPKKGRSKVATKKEVKTVAKIDFSKAPSTKELEAMSEDKLIEVIKDFNLPLDATVKKLQGELADDDAFFACVDEVLASLKSEEEKANAPVEAPKEEVKTRTKRTPAKEVETKVEVALVKIEVDDLPEGSALEAMSEKELTDTINKFGLDLKDELATLATGKLEDEAFFKIVDAIDAKIEAIANDINDGKEPTYPATTEEAPAKKARTKKPQASEPTLEAGNATDDGYEDIDLDNADISYDDINIEDVAEQA